MGYGKDGIVTAKLIGSVLIIAGCAGFGFTAAASHIREELAMGQFIRAISFMKSRLSTQLTPLPELCDLAGHACGSAVGNVLIRFSGLLQETVSENLSRVMMLALKQSQPLPPNTRVMLENLADRLGKFDLEGQLRELDAQLQEAQRILQLLQTDRTNRLRSYRTLGICAGAAIVILFI